MFRFFKLKFAHIDKLATLYEIESKWDFNDLATAIRVSNVKDEVTELLMPKPEEKK